ncbi:phage minor head protein [Gallibacterium anatis]|uniref:Phage head morphogenesis protein n=1 Tax=Gallibacterium anatis 4895 TaxID=1396510 RepID=A0A0A3A8L2_9PAST|nr:phage minor head protein [Gallibacterium anatis]KGQ57949.1 phage head morphogenesis protein [Gallibacterium anatis 4895]
MTVQSGFSFEEQVRYFAKKLNLPTDSYLDVLGEEHDYFFMVAGANRNEVLLAFRQAVDEAIERSGTLEEFRQRFDEIVAKTGWQYNGGRNWRTRIIYDTNVYAAYNRGRLQQHLDLADVMPYWEYQHNDNAHPRPFHVQLDGTIRPANDPFWRYYYPIKAYGCHCTVIAHDEDDLKAMGRTVSPPVEIEFEEKLVGVRSGNPRTINLPKGYDAGFAPHNFDNLKAGRLDSVDKVLMQKMVTADPLFASKAVNDLLVQPEIMALHARAFQDWVKQTAKAAGKELANVENIKLVGVIPAEVIEQLNAQKIAPTSAIIAMDKGNLLHALRELKENAQIAVPLDFWENLPNKLKQPTAILLEHQQDTPTLLFVYEQAGAKIAVKINYDAKLDDRVSGKGKKILINRLVTGSLVNSQAWEDFAKSYDLLWGTL